MRAIALIGVALWLAGCATLVPQLETPRLSIVNVELLKTDIFEQRMKVRLRVQNPNDRALPIRGLSYALEVAGEEFAQGVSNTSFTVPALGEAEFDTHITANVASTLIRLLGRERREREEAITYRISGRISLSQGWLRAIPFEERGTFHLKY